MIQVQCHLQINFASAERLVLFCLQVTKCATCCNVKCHGILSHAYSLV